MTRPPVLVLAGPTASGKSLLAMEISRLLPCEIVSADSMQVYRGMDIGTAKPTPEERREVPHHLLDLRDPDQPFSAGAYAPLAREAITGIASRGRLPILVGGTGLYLRSTLGGIVDAPPRDEELRRRFRDMEEKEKGSLHRLLAVKDPASAARIAPGDVVRLVRALEVEAKTGRTLSALQKGHGFACSPLRFLFLVLSPPRAALAGWIEDRVDAMLEKGWLDEVRALLDRGYPPTLPAMKAVGYRELTSFLRGGTSLGEAVERTKTETRRFAKRQITWFRAEREAEWLMIESQAAIPPLARALAERATRDLLSQDPSGGAV